MLVLLAVCLYTDLTARKIYNPVVLPALAAAVIFHLACGGVPRALWSLAGLFLGGALLFIPFLLGGIGAGDVKLLAAIGALQGPDFVLRAFLMGALAGGVLSAWQLLRQKRMLVTLKNFALLLLSLACGAPVLKNGPAAAAGGGEKTAIPYGAAIVAGAAAAYLAR